MKKTLYITATLPALTVTFIYREILRLRGMGMNIDTVSMNTPPDEHIAAAAKEFRQSTFYLDQQSFISKLVGFLLTLCRHPLRMVRCLRIFLTASPMKFPRDYARLGYHVIESAYLAYLLRNAKPDHIHSHFINGPTSIAMFTALLLDVPYSFTMHASMIWLDPIAFRNKLETCSFCVSISEYNRRYVIETYGQEFASKINIVHCGLDPETALLSRSEQSPGEPLRILGVGQLNRRKGFHVLIPALAAAKDRMPEFECTIIGDGAERPVLESLIREHDIGDRIKLAGAVLPEEVQEALANTDIFVLPCVISEDGWRDGIPVALMEAMFNEIPVVSTDILGLPELIEHQRSGLLVPATDELMLADAILALAEDAELRMRLGAEGRKKVIADFNNEKSAAQLLELISAG